ncbi:unnamed protein product, partial [Bubo scandiacus]
MTLVSNPVDSADQRQSNSKIHVLTDCGSSCITSICHSSCPPASGAFMQLVSALGESPIAQAHVKGITMTTDENIWIELKLNWDDIKK